MQNNFNPYLEKINFTFNSKTFINLSKVNISGHFTLYCVLSENNFINLTKIVECVLAIPIGNDYVERVFSVITNLWTDERNQMRISLVKAEVCIKFNFDISCTEFYDFVKNNIALLNAVKSEKKYSFIKNK